MQRFLFNQFYRVYRLSRRVTRRLTGNGMIIVAATALTATIGIDTKSNLNSLTFSFFTILLVIAIISSRRRKLNIIFRRDLPVFATVEEPVSYTLTIQNKSNKAIEETSVIDQLKDHPPTFNQFKTTSQPNNTKVNFFDRVVGYPKWVWLNARNRGGDIPPTPLPDIRPDQTARIDISFTPKRRGTIHFDALWMLRPDPLGLINSLQLISKPDSITVLPLRYEIPVQTLSGSSAFQPGGVSLASHTGDSEEFVSLRDYRPGDSMRSIHWKSWAKTGKPIIKETQPEYIVRNALVLDTCIDTKYADHFEHSVSIAASFLQTLDTRESLIDLLFVGETTCQLTMGRGVGHRHELLKAVANARIASQDKFHNLEQTVISQAKSFSGCILVFSQWEDNQKNLFNRLKQKRITCIALVVCNDDETVIDRLTKQGCIPIPVSDIKNRLASL